MKAYNQGNVDFFCAVYAVINACRLAMRKHKKLDFFEGCAFYQHLMQALIDKGLIEEVLHQGSNYEVMQMLLEEARAYLYAKFELKLLFKRPFVCTSEPVSRVMSKVRTFLGRNNHVACVMRFFNTGVLDHWSVVRRGYGLRLKLMDSYNYPEINVRACAWAPYRKDGKNYIAKEGIILIKVCAPQ